MIIVFEGFDKTGKSSIIKEFNKLTNYKHLVIDRGPWSCLFFDKVLRKDKRMYALHSLDADKMSSVVDLIVYCECPKEVALLRLKHAKEEVPPYFTEYYANHGLYKQIISENISKRYSKAKMMLIATQFGSATDKAKLIDALVCQVEATKSIQDYL